MQTYTLVPIHLGKINLDLGIMTYRMNYGTRKWLPIISWYVKVGEENILIDSGISSAESAYYTESPVEDLIDFEGGLQKVGITPADVDWVIQTHLHFDHVGGCVKYNNDRSKLSLVFPKANHYCSKEQWDWFLA
ncbi:MAG: MBL fold metallo-hydrolase [Thermodesulfobacteriota bacterium]